MTRILAAMALMVSMVSMLFVPVIAAATPLQTNMSAMQQVALASDDDIVLAGTVRCTPQSTDPVCLRYRQQQGAPKLSGPKSPTTEPMRCETLVTDTPSAIVLRKGLDNTGDYITSWRLSVLNWRSGGGGYIVMVCYPRRYDVSWPDKTFCADDGHYWFKVDHTSREYGAFCVGSDDFCGR